MVRHWRATVNRNEPDRSIRRNLHHARHRRAVSRTDGPCHVALGDTGGLGHGAGSSVGNGIHFVGFIQTAYPSLDSTYQLKPG